MKGEGEQVLDEGRLGRSLRNLLTAIATVVLGALAAILAYWVVGDVKSALAWGGSVGALVVRADPQVFLALTVLFVILTPLALIADSELLAENLARTALALLALGVVLEFRQGPPPSEGSQPSEE